MSRLNPSYDEHYTPAEIAALCQEHADRVRAVFKAWPVLGRFLATRENYRYTADRGGKHPELGEAANAYTAWITVPADLPGVKYGGRMPAVHVCRADVREAIVTARCAALDGMEG